MTIKSKIIQYAEFNPKIKVYLSLYVALSFCVSFSLFAQENKTVKGEGSVFGNVKENLTNSIIEFATVSLFNISDSSLVTGAVTDINGDFKVVDVPYGNYYAKIAFIGYKALIINDILITKTAPDYNVSEISLENFSQNMDEFIVVGEKELVEVKIDKTVYNVSKDPASQGGNGLDVLRNLPSVDVDVEDNISLRNDKSVQILIDGRPSPISASQLLKDIPATLIEKVEVITNPSAKYNPEGMSGIINVVLKKEKAVGLNGNVNASIGYGTVEKHNGSLNINYRKKKLNVYAMAGLYKWSGHNGGPMERTYNLNDSTYYQNFTVDNDFEARSYWYLAGIDYFLNKKNTFYLVVTGWNGWNGSDHKYRYDFMDSNKVLQNYSNRHTDNKNPYYGGRINAGWQRQFNDDGDHTLDIDITHVINSNERRDSTKEDFFLANNDINGLSELQNTSMKTEGNYTTLTIDYELPINDSMVFEAGIYFDIQNMIKGFYSESNKDSLSVLSSDDHLNNTMNFSQNVNALYFTLSKQYKSLGIKIGTRLENVTVKPKLVNTNEEFNKSYTSLFPSVYFSYKIKKASELKLSYSRRINRPNSWEMTPFSSYSDPFVLSVGNPDLDPEYINVYEFGYLFQGTKITLTPNIYYRQITDKKTWFASVAETGVATYSVNNQAKLNIVGAEVNLRYSPFKWWRITTTLNIYQSTFEDLNIDGSPNEINNGWSFQLSSSKTFKKGLSIKLDGRYRGKDKGLQGITLPNYDVALAIMKKVFKEKGSISIRFTDLLNTQMYQFESVDLGGASYTDKWEWESQTVFLSFSYSFGSMKEADNKKRSKKTISAEDNFSTGTEKGK
ncbi:MAG: outer membrane beta-barrel family protein [Bacteroidota bacterium]